MPQVDTTRTPQTQEQIGSLLAQLATPVKWRPYVRALVDVENANGRSVYNNNFGNITTNNDQRPWMYLGDDRARKFMSFPSPQKGMQALLKRLQSPTHGRMLKAAERDDVGEFVQAMTTPHPDTGMMYCDTCEPAATLRTYEQILDRYRKRGSNGTTAGALAVAALGVAGTVIGLIFSMRKALPK